MKEGDKVQKERWKFGRYEEPPKHMNYYKEKQRLTWQFFIRVSMSWMTPCAKCQAMIDDKLQKDTRYFLHENIEIPQTLFNYLCRQCKEQAYKIVQNGTLILGNNEYSPALELSRNWVSIENTMTKISKEMSQRERFKRK